MAVSGAPVSSAPVANQTAIKLNLRSQKQTSSGEWKSFTRTEQQQPSRAAIIICDMWDRHWCNGANVRGAVIAKRMEAVLQAARKKGVLIIHAPSECMDAYKDTPQRKLAMAAPKSDPPTSRTVAEPPLPIDDSDGGCDDQPQCKTYKAWSR